MKPGVSLGFLEMADDTSWVSKTQALFVVLSLLVRVQGLDMRNLMKAYSTVL